MDSRRLNDLKNQRISPQFYVRGMARRDSSRRARCPVCGEWFSEFEELHQHLLEHCDEGIAAAEDYLEACLYLVAEETMEEAAEVEDGWCQIY